MASFCHNVHGPITDHQGENKTPSNKLIKLVNPFFFLRKSQTSSAFPYGPLCNKLICYHFLQFVSRKTINNLLAGTSYKVEVINFKLERDTSIFYGRMPLCNANRNIPPQLHTINVGARLTEK